MDDARTTTESSTITTVAILAQGLRITVLLIHIRAWQAMLSEWEKRDYPDEAAAAGAGHRRAERHRARESIRMQSTIL